jgi:hypothetical protein
MQIIKHLHSMTCWYMSIVALPLIQSIVKVLIKKVSVQIIQCNYANSKELS